MAFSDAFARSSRAGQATDPELLAVCERLTARGWDGLVPEAVRQAPPAASQQRRAAGIANALLAADRIARELADPGDPEQIRGRAAALLVLVEHCFEELSGWLSMVLERSGRGRNEPIGSSKLNARLRLLDPVAAGRVADLAEWVATVRLTTVALMQRSEKTLRIRGGETMLQLPGAAGGGGGERPMPELGTSWVANLRDLIGAAFACGAARLTNPRERASADFDWD